MLSVNVRLIVKFRAFGITFGTVDKQFAEPIPVVFPVQGLIDLIPGLPKLLIKFNDRGVFLAVTLDKAVIK